MSVLHALGHALGVAGSMTWQITWSLILGFTLASIISALVRRETIVRLLGDDRPKTLLRATGFGAASSSCSYAAVALARALFRKGASFTAAMVFEIASTNLVVELGIILALLITWQFTLAEFVGGPIMIVLVAVAFRLFVRKRLIDAAREQADKGLAGSMEGHAAMDMSIQSGGSLRRRLVSREGYTAVSHIFVMEWAAVIRDVVIGLLIAGAIGAWVPNTFWQHLFLTGHPLAARLWGPLIGPVISMLSFVCSIGNVPLAGVLWNGGISFGGVVAFLFADLIIIPILLIYRKYYGTRMMLVLLGVFYATMAIAGYIVEFLFGALGLVPSTRTAKVGEQSIVWNYTTVLNIIFLLLAAALLIRFFRSGGGPMLRMMGGSPDEHEHHSHGGADHDGAGHVGADHGAQHGADHDADRAAQHRAEHRTENGAVISPPGAARSSRGPGHGDPSP
ncbi:MAG TPA: permease [Streptosporangiaceae bacterium]|nr:permease [Streptosporangiaceae bacterium]